jgi:transposase
MMDKNEGLRPKRKYEKYSWSFKRQVIMEYLDGAKGPAEIAAGYGIRDQLVCRWGKEYLADAGKKNVHTFEFMENEERKQYEALKTAHEALKKELELAQMKAKALEIMIDLAKSELGVDVRKNSGARQPDR